MIRDAGFNLDRTRRLWLLRRWNQLKPVYAYIGLNPSKADERRDDATIKKLMGFTDRFGGGSFLMFNANDIIETDSRALKQFGNGVNSVDNYVNMLAMIDDYKPERVVCMWGTNGNWLNGDKTVLGMLKAVGIEPWAFKITKDGHPQHPLYLPWTTELIRMPT